MRGLESLPSGGGALIVGNHSGGMLTPDVLIFAAAFYRRFGYQRPLYTLGHHGMFVGPMSGWLGRLGDTHELTDAMANAFCEIHAAAGLSDGIAAVQAAPADATAGVAHAEKGRR
ncbi:1-acyl-sn-glycerol-3-phosphate acyltransferase [Mycobacterium sp. MUNTM1]